MVSNKAGVNSGNIMQMVQDPKNWKKTRKKSYEVYVCRPLPGTECKNHFEGAQYKTDSNKQFIMSGTRGENWVIDAGKLAKTYTFEDGTPITPDTLKAKLSKDGQMPWKKLKTRPDGVINFAMHLPTSITDFPVKTSWGDTLLANRSGIPHGYGDFLVCADNGAGQPNLNDVWVVNGEIFPRTYDLHAFPNMFNEEQSSPNTQAPKTNFIKVSASNVVAGGDSNTQTSVNTRANNKLDGSSYLDNITNEMAEKLRQLGDRIISVKIEEDKKYHDPARAIIVDKGLVKVDQEKTEQAHLGKYKIVVYNRETEEEPMIESEIFISDGSDHSWKSIMTWFTEDFGLQPTVKALHDIMKGTPFFDYACVRASENTMVTESGCFYMINYIQPDNNDEEANKWQTFIQGKRKRVARDIISKIRMAVNKMKDSIGCEAVEYTDMEDYYQIELRNKRKDKTDFGLITVHYDGRYSPEFECNYCYFENREDDEKWYGSFDSHSANELKSMFASFAEEFKK